MTFRETHETIHKALRFGTFQAEVQAAAEGCEDFRADSRGLGYESGDHLRYVADLRAAGSMATWTEAATVEDGQVKMQGEADLTTHAFGQLLERLDGPPMQWIGNPRHADEDLRALVMNDLITARKPVELLLRTRGEILRAVLSDQYTPFDNVGLIDLVAGALQQMGPAAGDVKVHKAQVGDELRGYVLLPGITFGRDPGTHRGPISPEGWQPGDGNGSNGDGGGLHPGIYLSNSEIGTGRVRIHGGLFRGVCSNGMIFGWKSKLEGALDLIHRGLSKRTMLSAVGDAIVGALRLSEAGAERFIESQGEILEPAAIAKLTREWGDKYGLTLPSIEAWTTLVRSEAATEGRQAPALFDLVNGLTFLARDRRGGEAEDMERLAGDLLWAELPVGVFQGQVHDVSTRRR